MDGGYYQDTSTLSNVCRSFHSCSQINFLFLTLEKKKKENEPNPVITVRVRGCWTMAQFFITPPLAPWYRHSILSPWVLYCSRYSEDGGGHPLFHHRPQLQPKVLASPGRCRSPALLIPFSQAQAAERRDSRPQSTHLPPRRPHP